MCHHWRRFTCSVTLRLAAVGNCGETRPVDVRLHLLDRCSEVESTSLHHHHLFSMPAKLACIIHYATAAMDIKSHLFIFPIITDLDHLGQTAQTCGAHIDHHCESTRQPVLTRFMCMHTYLVFTFTFTFTYSSYKRVKGRSHTVVK